MILGHILSPGEQLKPGDRRLFEAEDVPCTTPGLVKGNATEHRKRPLLSGEKLPSVDGGGVVTENHHLFFRPWTRDDLPAGADEELEQAKKNAAYMKQAVDASLYRIRTLEDQNLELRAKLEVYEKMLKAPMQVADAQNAVAPWIKERAAEIRKRIHEADIGVPWGGTATEPPPSEPTPQSAPSPEGSAAEVPASTSIDPRSPNYAHP